MIDGGEVFDVQIDGERWMTLLYRDQADRALARFRRDPWFRHAKKFEVVPRPRNKETTT